MLRVTKKTFMLSSLLALTAYRTDTDSELVERIEPISEIIEEQKKLQRMKKM